MFWIGMERRVGFSFVVPKMVLIYLYEILFHYAMQYSDSLKTTAIFNTCM
jgi:hypothetical protein